MAAQVGFEPTKCQSQNLMPYHLATGQFHKYNNAKVESCQGFLFIFNFLEIKIASAFIELEEVSENLFSINSSNKNANNTKIQ